MPGIGSFPHVIFSIYGITLPCLFSLDPSDPNPYPWAAMKLYKSQLLIIFTLLVGLNSFLKAQGPQAANGQQLLLLRNGQALEGQINRSGDVYRIALSDGEIRVKAADVEFVCTDYEEGYQRKRAAIPIGSLRDHLDLAQWCQQHKLYDHAAAELADAAAIAPANPMVGFLQRRLQMSTEPLPDPPKTETSRDNSISNEELDRMVRGLPHKAIENFTQTVQPLLMNNCTTSGCHGPQSENGLRLQRIPQDLPAGRRLTQRNIYAVLQYVNRDNPLASRMLTVPTAPHGTAKMPSFYRSSGDAIQTIGRLGDATRSGRYARYADNFSQHRTHDGGNHFRSSIYCNRTAHSTERRSKSPAYAICYAFKRWRH